MSEKPSVSVLQEFCAKQKFDTPTYDYIDSVDGGFLCIVSFLEMEAHAIGRSKRDAKHLAAGNMIKKIRKDHPEIDEIPQMETEEIPTSDMIVTLRDYCVQNNHPLPIIQIVQQGGTPNAPQFVALCQVATIKRYGSSENKKDARQKAAFKVYRIISMNADKTFHQTEVANISSKGESVEEERYRKFKSYRELTDSNMGDMPGVLLCDRHNFFSSFYPQLKKNAFEVLNKHYESPEEQCMDFLKALKLKPKFTEMPSLKQKLIMVEFDCEYDMLLVETEDKIYKHVLEYFRDML